MTFEHESSTQYQQWTFTRKSLEETRIASHDVNIATVREAIKRESQLANISTPSPEFITYAHQLELCAFFESRFIEYCKLFKFDTTILGTAIIFFKRFYISASLMDHDPKIILLTCLYISSKVENLKMPLEDFLSKIPKAPLPQVILASEITVSNHLKFHFKIHHPFWPLHGYFLDLQTFLQKSAATKHSLTEKFKKLAATYVKAREIAISSLLTDLPLIYWPSQIAMMCFYKASKETEFLEDLDSYFHDRLDSVCDKLDIDKADDSEGTFGNLKNLIDGMQVYFGKKTDKAEAQRITRILEGCRNPYSDPESLVSKEKDQEEKRIQEEKRSKKIKINHEKSAQLAKVFN